MKLWLSGLALLTVATTAQAEKLPHRAVSCAEAGYLDRQH